MYLINPQLGIVGNLFPDTYVATSVEDIISSIEEIKKPSKWSLRNNLSGIGYPGEVLILSYDMNLELDDNEDYIISDVTGRISINRSEGNNRTNPNSIPLCEIAQGKTKYHEVQLLHQPHGGCTSLYGAMRGKPVKESKLIEKIRLIGQGFLSPEPVL